MSPDQGQNPTEIVSPTTTQEAIAPQGASSFEAAQADGRHWYRNPLIWALAVMVAAAIGAGVYLATKQDEVSVADNSAVIGTDADTVAATDKESVDSAATEPAATLDSYKD